MKQEDNYILKKLQHYVPQFYLRQFAFKEENDKYFLKSLFKNQGNVVKEINVKYVASEKYFYDRDYPQPIENYLSIAENDISKTYHKIIERRSLLNLIGKDKFHLVMFTYFQFVRTNSARTKFHQIFNNELKKLKQDHIAKKGLESFKKLKEYVLKKYVKKVQKILIYIDDSTYEIMKKNYSPSRLKTLLNKKKEIIAHLKSLDFHLLEIKDSNLEFYSSDNPIGFYSKDAQMDGEGLTFLNILDKSTQIFFPFSPKFCIILFDSHIYDYKLKYPEKKQVLTEVDGAFIRLINDVITLEAKRIIISKSGDFKFALEFLDKNPYARHINRRRIKKD